MLSKNNQQTAIPYLLSLLSNHQTFKKSNTITEFKKLVNENIGKRFRMAAAAFGSTKSRQQHPTLKKALAFM